MIGDLKFLPAGDKGLVVQFGDEISEAINDSVNKLMKLLIENDIDSIEEMIPTYRSLLVIYNPNLMRYSEIVMIIKGLLTESTSDLSNESIVYEIPTLYGGDVGIDLDFVAENAGMSKDEVINIHSSREYRIYMLGFSPGFPYLGGMDERIATPRLTKPRPKVSGGSVGIAGKQTGIYPVDSPGGWRFIGKTPIKLYDENRDDPILLKSGNYLKFVPISEEEYMNIEKEILRGSYKVKTYSKVGDSNE